MGQGMQAGAPLIALRGITRHYGGGDSGQPAVTVLHGIDLEIRAGEFVAVVGSSGSGKSTLMNILGCLDRPSEGSYHFQGQDVASLDSDALAWLRREAFGFVFQGYHLIASESASENVEMPAIYAGLPKEERVRRARSLLTRLGLGTRLGNRPNQLSGGQQQRVSIARALMNGGQIILADEPTGALDSHSGAEVMALLRELADAGHTIILITHDRAVAAQARRVIEISDGRITSDSQRDEAAKPGGAAQPLTPQRGGASAPWLAELFEAARSAWRGMRMNRVRTSLTLLGIVIGVASVIVMLAIGEGARRKVVEQMGTMGTAILYMGSKPPSTGGPAGQMTEEDLAAVRELPEIRRVMPVIGDPITVRYGKADKQIYVFAASEEMPLVHHWKVAQGRYFTEAEDRDLAPLVVLGHKAHRHFFPDTPNPLGRQLIIGTSSFEVIGVMSERGADSGAQDYDDMVFIPYRSGRARVYQSQTQPDYVVIEAMSSDVVHEAEEAMRKLLLARHGGREDFGIGNAAARIQAEAATRQSMAVMLGLIAAVSLVVGGIGVMNVMLMTVRERTREIGIRMATGARQRDILRQFLTEASLVTFVGGTVGLFAGLAVGVVLIVAGVPVVFSVRAMLGAFACAVVTGLVFGYMPAKTAARLDPVRALAGE
ncbi:Macrolide export ATP-binding/permease protein MacB [Delftia tsuruhatensis]|uniref:ABC transporter permease n=1 Tax=Delftia tsuruhatensis TaxID=180282 RepID=UPI001E6F89CE|nr:ABC transporter permease [Delftia tsuruhatensis]CAB5716300.1 Macrolide export ATP-binding/permease protein MacB [Delftia tsuruhatensis]CAC9686058.1 Macrolide export ATP-binding/permease protein MacB [Delftia tsuruhatensis]